MQMFDETAPALIKQRTITGLPSLAYYSILQSFVEDKEYDLATVIRMSKRQDGANFGRLMESLVMRSRVATQDNIKYWNSLCDSLRDKLDRVSERYIGSPAQNARIDRSLSIRKNPNTQFVGNGAAGFYGGRTFDIVRGVRNVPIAIIGNGAAGLIVAKALREIGFLNITSYEKSKDKGIWAQRNVFEGTRNNPRNIGILGTVLKKAPGDGIEVVQFLESFRERGNLPVITNSIVEVKPNNFAHKLILRNGSEATYPIVINAMGLGKPRPLNDPQRMTAPNHVPAGRWQQPKLELNKIVGQRFIFVGLGNSTAEMIRQLHKAEDAGYEIDYRIITHYPRDAVYNPSDYVHGFCGSNDQSYLRAYRVFRDISKPNLTSFQGDLPLARADYQRALINNRIISDVTDWKIRGEKIITTKDRDHSTGFRLLRIREELNFNQMFVLTGYKHDAATWNSMGIASAVSSVYSETFPLYDFDGEFIAKPESLEGDRLHKGYFGFGAVLDAPHNRNAIVIPGMVFRLPDLLFGIIMRANEYDHSFGLRPVIGE